MRVVWECRWHGRDAEDLLDAAGFPGDVAAETTVTPLGPPGYELLDTSSGPKFAGRPPSDYLDRMNEVTRILRAVEEGDTHIGESLRLFGRSLRLGA